MFTILCWVSFEEGIFVSFFQDVKTAVRLTGEVRKARKAGASAVKLKPVHRVPLRNFGYFSFTMEACILRGDAFKAVCKVFETFPEPVQHSLTFTPQKPGEWVKRARLWQRELKPALPPDLYHDVMQQFIA